MPYSKPKVRLHRDFVFLNDDSILNSLSALEAGKVDEIIEKTSEATDRGIEGSIGHGALKAGGSKKKQAQLESELVKIRTRFSAFEAWYQHLKASDAFGTFDEWNLETRDEIEVGDTIEFRASVALSPLYLLLTSFQSFVEKVNKPGSPFKMSGAELKQAKDTAAMMKNWVSRPDGTRGIVTYFEPFGIKEPRIIGTLEENYVVGGLDNVRGGFTVVAQVDSVLDKGERVSVIRVLSDVPPTPKEIEVAEESMSHFIDNELGVELTDDDLTFSHPVVIVRPLAVYK